MACACVVDHVPKVRVVHRHHVLPISWGGEGGERVELCPTSHEGVHRLLNAYVHAGGTPPWSERRLYPEFIRTLAARAWDQRPSDRPPFTAAGTMGP